jgi:hypothetical protein
MRVRRSIAVRQPIRSIHSAVRNSYFVNLNYFNRSVKFVSDISRMGFYLHGIFYYDISGWFV